MKFQAITDHLRERIVSGEFLRGKAIPQRHELLSQYEVSLGAFQRSINALIQEGYLESRGVKGVWVTQHPPHLSRFALVLPVAASSRMSEDSIWPAIEAAAGEMARKKGIRFEFYLIGNRFALVESEIERLKDDVAKHRLAGAIFFHNSWYLPPLPKEFPMIRFGFSWENQADQRQLRIDADYLELFRQSRDLLLKNRCSSIATIVVSNLNTPILLDIKKMMVDTPHVYMPEEWLQGISLSETNRLLVNHLIKLIFRADPAHTPDGLIVMNENLLPTVIESLERQGIIVNRDVKVVSHCNHPASQAPYPGVSYIGFNAFTILEQCIELLKSSHNQTNQSSEEYRITPEVIVC